MYAVTQNAVNWSLIAVGVIGSSALTATLNWIFNRRKDQASTLSSEASAAEMIQKASASLIAQVQEHASLTLKFQKEQNLELVRQVVNLEAQVNRLETAVKRIPQLESDIMELTHGINLLVQQLQEHNITPIYPPLPPSTP
jgi:hypothetical protein